jgi:cytochrome b involved in lipid metabolism
MNSTEGIITWAELATHSTEDSLWILIEGNVYAKNKIFI